MTDADPDSKPCKRPGCPHPVLRGKRSRAEFARRGYHSRACAHAPGGQARSGNPNGLTDPAAAARTRWALTRADGKPALGMTAADRTAFRARLGFTPEPPTTPGARRA